MRNTLLPGGRPTRFAPTREASRASASGVGLAPEADPETTRDNARAAVSLLSSLAFQTLMEQIKGEQFERFENATFGKAGRHDRETAHAVLYGIDVIIRRLEIMQEDAKIYERREEENRRDADHDAGE